MKIPSCPKMVAKSIRQTSKTSHQSPPEKLQIDQFTLYLPAGHSGQGPPGGPVEPGAHSLLIRVPVHGPPSGPVNPGLHWHIVRLPTSTEEDPAGQSLQLQFATAFHVASNPSAVFEESEVKSINIVPVFASYTVVLPSGPLSEATVAAARRVQLESEHFVTFKVSNPASVLKEPKLSWSVVSPVSVIFQVHFSLFP